MKSWLWLLLGLLVSATAWFYMHRVLLPWEYHVNVEGGRLKAEMGDLYPRWVGARALLLDGRNPYGPEVSHEIQMGFYGRPIVQSYDDPGAKIVDEQRFAYPVYVVFLLAPTVHAAFTTVQSWAPVVLAALTAVSILLWLAVLRWHPPKAATAAIVLLILSSPQVAQGLRLRQLGLFAACLLALSAWCVSRNHLASAGIILASSTIKPQMVVLPVLWFLLWSLGDWRKRWHLLAGFFIALAALIGAGELMLPGWIHDFVAGIVAYRRYVPEPDSLLQVALGRRFGEVIGIIVIAGLLAWAWRNRHEPADSQSFALTLAAFFICASLALPLVPPFNQVLLIFPVLMILRDWARLGTFLRLIFVAGMSWPFVASLALLLVFPPRLDSMSRFPLLPSFFVLFVPFIVPFLIINRRSAVLRSQ